MGIWNLEPDAPPESINYRIQIQIWIGFRVLWIRPVNTHPLRRPRGDLRRSPVPKFHVYYVHTSPPSSSVNCCTTGKSQSARSRSLLLRVRPLRPRLRAGVDSVGVPMNLAERAAPGQMVGLLKVRVLRGVNLAVRDLWSSDPYVILKMGKQVRR